MTLRAPSEMTAEGRYFASENYFWEGKTTAAVCSFS